MTQRSAAGPDRTWAARLLAPLTSKMRLGPLKWNMPLAGDFGFEAIQKLGNPVAMTVTNDGGQLLELWLEPFGQDYWLQPGETVVVTSYGRWDTCPFEAVHEPNRITVWATSFFATVSDRAGKEIPGAHQRPSGKYGN